MKTYGVRCKSCGKQNKHGTSPPANLDTCFTARQLRMRCHEPMGCRMEIVEREFEPTEVDMLRLGLREDRAIA